MGKWPYTSEKRVALPGDRFGRLVVVREASPSFSCGRPVRRVLVKCDCGTVKESFVSCLFQSKGCGCVFKERKIKVVSGAKFGRLTVLREVDSDGYDRKVLCKCSCGTKKVLSLFRIGKHVKSCGCLKREPKKRKILSEGDKFLLSLRKRIQHALYDSLKRLGKSKRGKSTFEILGYSKEAAYKYLSSFLGNPCAARIKCNGVLLNHGNCEIDHVFPLSKAKTEQEVIDLNKLENIRLICSSCNRSKYNKVFLVEIPEIYE